MKKKCQSRDGAVVRALVSHQRGPRVRFPCGLSLSILYSAPLFPSPQTQPMICYELIWFLYSVTQLLLERFSITVTWNCKRQLVTSALLDPRQLQGRIPFPTTPPPPPHGMTYGFLIQPVFCKRRQSAMPFLSGAPLLRKIEDPPLNSKWTPLISSI